MMRARQDRLSPVYTYFVAQLRCQLTEYLTELSGKRLHACDGFFVNTPDIWAATAARQPGGVPSASRLAMLSPSWGVYSGYSSARTHRRGPVAGVPGFGEIPVSSA
jgi:hypothetical protein